MPLAGVLGYALAAVAFLALTALLAAGWQGRRQGLRLIVASGVTAAWGAWLAVLAWRADMLLVLVLPAEALRTAAWLVVLAQLAGTGGLSRVMTRFSYAAWLGLMMAGPVAAWVVPALLPGLATAGGLLLALTGLVMLEQIYRNSSASGRWGLLYLYIGLGGVFVYDVFLYSQSMLLQGVSEQAWYARGYVAALAVPFVAIAARRNPAWSLQVFVSREVVFHTTSFLAIGAYLLLMSAGGYVVRLIGGSWGAVLQIVFVVAALGLLVVLIGSSGLRRRLRVFLVKHFYRNKYDYREEWLRFIATLSTGSGDEPAPVTGLRAVAQIIGSPGAALLRSEHDTGKWLMEACWPADDLLAGSPPPTGPGAMAEWLERRHWVIDLAEYRRDPEIYAGLDVPGWLAERQGWRLVVPVLLGDSLYAILLLRDPPEGFELTFEDRDLLKTTARNVATHLAQHDSERHLAEGREFAAFTKLSAFMMHDLKNAVAQLELIVANAARHKHNPDFIDDAIETVDGAARRITRLIDTLQRRNVADEVEPVDLAALIRETADRVAVRSPHPQVSIEGTGPTVLAGRERLGSVLEHVIRNAQDAASASGRVEVSLRWRDGRACIEVADDGVGMTPEFVRERLFRPFDSTKGSKGMGIGAYQAREYVHSLKGVVDVESAPGRGTRFRISLPLAAELPREGAPA